MGVRYQSPRDSDSLLPPRNSKAESPKPNLLVPDSDSLLPPRNSRCGTCLFRGATYRGGSLFPAPRVRSTAKSTRYTCGSTRSQTTSPDAAGGRRGAGWWGGARTAGESLRDPSTVLWNHLRTFEDKRPGIPGLLQTCTRFAINGTTQRDPEDAVGICGEQRRMFVPCFGTWLRRATCARGHYLYH